MQQRSPQQQSQSQRFFTASEVAEFEYCPLVWWYEQFEPAARADNEDLLAHLVRLEHKHGAQAPALPEYQMVEQLLVRNGAFEQGREQHEEHAEAVAEIEEERIPVAQSSAMVRYLAIAALVILVLALLFILIGLVLR